MTGASKEIALVRVSCISISGRRKALIDSDSGVNALHPVRRIRRLCKVLARTEVSKAQYDSRTIHLYAQDELVYHPEA